MRINSSSSKLSLPTLQNQPIKAKVLPNHSISKPSIGTLTEKARIRNYISLYSSTIIKPFSKQADRTDADIEETSNIGKSFSKMNSKIKSGLESVIKPGDCIATLTRKSSELLYEIKKAMSDKLELMRDVSTYEFEYTQGSFVIEKLSEIRDLALGIIEFESESDNLESMFRDGFRDLAKLDDRKGKFVAQSECFELKYPAYSKVKSTLLNCAVRISEISCIAHVYGTKWLEEIEVSILTMSNLSFKKSIKHSILSLYSTQQELTNILQSEVLSKFYFIYYSSHKTFILMHHPDHGEKFKVIFYSIRGFGNCSLSLSIFQSKLNIEVIQQKEILEVPLEILCSSSLENLDISLVKKIVRNHIYYDNCTRGFYWQDLQEPENVFSFKESSSNLLKDEYLKELLSMKSFKIIHSFSLQINEHEFTIELHSYKSQVKFLIFSDHESIEVPSESRNFRYLVDLQSFSIKSCPHTLKSSLELKLLIKKLFPRYFNIKLK